MRRLAEFCQTLNDTQGTASEELTTHTQAHIEAGAGTRGPDLVEFVIQQMEEQILHPMNYRLINAFDLVIAYVEAKMQEIKLLQRLDYLRHQPQRVGYETNTEDMRLIIWQQGRLSPSDWQRAFEELGLFDTFQKLTRIFDRGPYSRI